MKYTIIVQCPPSSTAIASSALKFSEALLNANHSIYRLFLYSDGVNLASQNTQQPQDEMDIYTLWKQFIHAHNIDTVVCIAAALKRGIIDDIEAKRYDLTSITGEPYTLSGLGQLIEACAHSDRTITFA